VLFQHCTFNLKPRAPSFDTPLRGFVPFTHVDHMHPDAIIAVAASADSRSIAREIFGDQIGWLPWKRPGFELGLWLRVFCAEHPAARSVVLDARDRLAAVYRERSLLKSSVYPEDIAEAVAFFAAEARSAKSTGNIFKVDAGHAPSFTR
jgi:rhamnose utilization protein RhaD (predicted bifunctional aldolase and dehydrogenase)